MSWIFRKFRALGLIAFFSLQASARQEASDSSQSANQTATSALLRIGVIGGGLGGCAASWFLRQELQEKVEIVVFEKDEIGGRVNSVMVNGQEYETGASIFHEKNKIFQNFLKEFDLRINDEEDDDEITAIVRGSEILFKTTGWSVVDAVKSIWRYGLSPLKLGPWVDHYIASFSRIYDLQAENCSFLRPADLLLAADPKFGEMFRTSLEDLMKSDGFSKTFIEELAEAAMRVNYNQPTSVPAFVGSVSLAGMKGPVHSVKGGNRQVALRTCRASSRIIRSTVSVIEALSDQKFRLHTPEGTEDFDLVILAAPLRKDAVNVVFKGFSDFFRPADWIGSYQRTVATLVEGDLNDTFFGSSTPLDSVINVQPGSLWNTVGRLRDVTGNASTTSGYSVWKIFSSSPLSSELLSRMFWRTFGAAQVDWRAYPNYAEPPRSPPPFALSSRLYYLNAIEWAGSAMEMSLISAKNIALAIANDVAAKSPQCSAPASKLQKSDL